MPRSGRESLIEYLIAGVGGVVSFFSNDTFPPGNSVSRFTIQRLGVSEIQPTRRAPMGAHLIFESLPLTDHQRGARRFRLQDTND